MFCDLVFMPDLPNAEDHILQPANPFKYNRRLIAFPRRFEALEVIRTAWQSLALTGLKLIPFP